MSMIQKAPINHFQSILILSSDPETRNSMLAKVLTKHFIADSDIIKIEIPEDKASIGIEQIQDLKKRLSISTAPDTIRAVVLYNVEKATIPAQNALLKTVEEPVSNTLIVLTASSKQSILQTIISRCHVLTTDTQQESINLEDYFIPEALGERLVLAEELAKDKQQTADWLDKTAAHYQAKLLKTPSQETKAILTKVSRSRTLITTSNVNTRLLLENLLLEI